MEDDFVKSEIKRLHRMDIDFIKSEIERLKEETECLRQMNAFLKWYLIIIIVGISSLICYLWNK